MKHFYAYTRVSTVKQGEKGVSLQEQHAAIVRYAEKQGLQITAWFEERLTAAKEGRPLFMAMINGLRKGYAEGVIIHKIDRSTRNLRDWADLGDLIDAGVAVHFANEGLDLHSRGGRLSADIQAVVASDYIRNLREEARKGIYGRLKQGIYPFGAPLGYLNMGGGRVKEIDPIRGPLVVLAFEQYASGNYTLDSLRLHLHDLGLRTTGGGALSRAGLSELLNNPFYTGIIRIKTTSEVYQGRHKPLISMRLFKRVGDRLAGRTRVRGWKHDFVFRGLFQCSLCHRILIGERQKGNNYYRCHSKRCQTKTFREEVLEEAILRSWPTIALPGEERNRLLQQIAYAQALDGDRETEHRVNTSTQIGASKARLARVIDAYLDGVLDKETFEARKKTLLEEQRDLENTLTATPPSPERLMEETITLLELASSAQQSYQTGSLKFRRELVIRLCSNCSVSGKHVHVEPYFPLTYLRSLDLVKRCGHRPNATRTLRRVARKFLEWAKQEVNKTDEEREEERERLLSPRDRKERRLLRQRLAA